MQCADVFPLPAFRRSGLLFMDDKSPRPVRLHLLTFPTPTLQPVCTDRLDCACPDCAAERARRVAQGPRSRRRDQPWIKRAA